MGETEWPPSAAHKERRRAQILFQDIEVLATVMHGDRLGPLHEPCQPVLHLPGGPGAAGGAPEFRGHVLHDLQLVVDVEFMLAGVALQPGQDHVAIQIDACYAPALQLPAFQLRQAFGDQTEGVRTRRQFGQIVHSLDRFQQRAGLPIRKGLMQIVRDLFVVERNEDEEAIIGIADVVAILQCQMRLLLAQRPEVVRAAGHHDATRPSGFFGSTSSGPQRGRQNPQQLPRELLTGRLGQMHQHLIQTIENDDGAFLPDQANDLVRLQLDVCLATLPGPPQQRLQDRFQVG